MAGTEPPPTIAATLTTASGQLQSTADSPRLEAELLLAHCLHKPRSHFYAWPENLLDTNTTAQFNALLARRCKGEPMAYITGEREFWSQAFYVTKDTLIPRADTELLVVLALEKIDQLSARQHPHSQQPIKLLDLGTGSGAIAISIALERPAVCVTACDKYHPALTVAKRNAQRHGLATETNFQLIQSDWFSNISAHQFDIIVSNPPYIDPADPHLTSSELQHEPRTALVAEQQGLADLTSITMQAKAYLTPTGWLLLEHGYDQAPAVTKLLTDNGYSDVGTRRDIEQRDRVTLAGIGVIDAAGVADQSTEP